MSAIFIGLVFLGLILAVGIMLFGVERQTSGVQAGERTFSVSPAVAATFAVTAGVVGYLLLRANVRPGVIWASALGAGVVVSLIAARAVARWWLVVPEHDVDDERYVLQGGLGRVTAEIAEKGVGQIKVTMQDVERLFPARAVDQLRVATGTEVVIERIEDGIAFVEQWAEVEKRL